jgi:hypothetical protein
MAPGLGLAGHCGLDPRNDSAVGPRPVSLRGSSPRLRSSAPFSWRASRRRAGRAGSPPLDFAVLPTDEPMHDHRHHLVPRRTCWRFLSGAPRQPCGERRS